MLFGVGSMDRIKAEVLPWFLLRSQTSERKLIDYKMKSSWNNPNGLFGLYFYDLREPSLWWDSKGVCPFDSLTINGRYLRLAAMACAQNPPEADRQSFCEYIYNNVASCIVEAMFIRVRS
jgi:hypothetical protein